MNTIDKRQIKDKELLLEQFRKTPIVQIACEKAGLGRATYYRWRKDQPEFAKEADIAIEDGNRLINDMAESQLLSAIRDKNMTAIIFWLKHHHSTYTTRVEVTTFNKDHEIHLTEEQKELLDKAIQMAALVPSKTNEHE